MMNIFLSSSIPYPGRNELYLRTANVIAIKSSVKALTQVFIPYSNIVFGSHPAITPVLANMMRYMPREHHGRIKPYVSKKFKAVFPPEMKQFIDVVYTENIDDEILPSLKLMRQRMIEETKFDAAFFIGGMEGIEIEYDLFRKSHPNAKTFPIASTGGASLELYNKLEYQRDDLLRERTYPKLFAKIKTELMHKG